MRIQITVKPNSKKEALEKLESGEYLVRVKAPAREGKANEAVAKLLAKHFGVSKSQIEIVRGLGGRKKWVDILDG